jgi:hypothetical protein
MLSALALWQLVVLRILQYNVVHKILMKKAADAPGSQTERLIVFFLICALIAFMLWLFYGTPLGLFAGSIIFAFGILNAAACFAEWKAFSISLTLASVFTILDDVVAISGGFFIFHEEHILDSVQDAVLLGGGSLAIFAAIGALIYAASQVRESSGEGYELSWREKVWVVPWLFGAEPRTVVPKEGAARITIHALSAASLKVLLLAVLIKSLIRGNIPLLLKHFSLSEGMNEFNFLLAWYFGSALGAMGIWYWCRGEKVVLPDKFKWKSIGLLILLSLSAWFGLAFTYHIYHLGTIIAVQPILAAAEAVLPVFVGLFFFSEAEQLWRLERAGRWAFWFCALGTGMVILTFY